MGFAVLDSKIPPHFELEEELETVETLEVFGFLKFPKRAKLIYCMSDDVKDKF